MGSDLGGAVKGFKDGMKDGTARRADPAAPTQQVGTRSAASTRTPSTSTSKTTSKS